MLCLVGLVAACQPPHAVVTVEDPFDVASGATTIAVGPSLESLESRDFDGAFPTTLTVVGEDGQALTVWVEASAAGSVLARGTGVVELDAGESASLVVRIGPPCDADESCDDGVFCNGEETCGPALACIQGPPACLTPHGCVEATCMEEAQACDVQVRHDMCPGGEYCSPTDGCIAGEGCLVDSECQDTSACNGEERCLGFRCEAGIPPDQDDQKQCTTDFCAEPNGVDHLPVADGTLCDDGICVAGACIASECGDGFVDTSRGETCDDQNDDPNDRCHQCVEPTWTATVLFGLGAPQNPSDVSLSPSAVTVDGFGNVFVADAPRGRLLRVDAQTQKTTVIAGRGYGDAEGDGLPAHRAALSQPTDVDVDHLGNIYVTQQTNAVRRIDPEGIISRVAGGGSLVPDNIPALDAQLVGSSVFVDGSDHLLIGVRPLVAGGWGELVRLDLDASWLTRLAGDRQASGDVADGRPAVGAPLKGVEKVLRTPDGTILFADGASRVYAIDPKGVLTTFAGGGTLNALSGPIPATSLRLNRPTALAWVPVDGDILIAGVTSGLIHKVDRSGLATIYAGTGVRGFSGDGGPPKDAQFQTIFDIDVDESGRVFVADIGNHRVRIIESGTIDTFIGTGTSAPASFEIVDRSARSIVNTYGTRIDYDASGALLAADIIRKIIFRVDEARTVQTFAGWVDPSTGVPRTPAVDTVIESIDGFVSDRQRYVYFSESNEGRIIRVDVAAGTRETFAELTRPGTLAIDGNGTIYAYDAGPPSRIVSLDPMTGAATPVPGTADVRFDAMAVAPNGDVYVAPMNTRRVDRIRNGVAETVAGNGMAVGWPCPDGSAATGPCIEGLTAMAFDPAGALYVAERSFADRHVARIDLAQNQIFRVAGGGTAAVAEGRPATELRLDFITSIGVSPTGTVVFATIDPPRPGLVFELDAMGRAWTRIGERDPIGDGRFSVARLSNAGGLIRLDAERMLIADDAVLREAHLGTQLLETVVGVTNGLSQDGSEARVSRLLGGARGLAYDQANGSVFVSEANRNEIRRVALSSPWTVERFVGTGAAGANDGNGNTARFNGPTGLYFDATERMLYVADSNNHTVRRVNVDSPNRTVTRIAGRNGIPGATGDGGRAGRSTLNEPAAVTRCGDSIYIAERAGNRVRRILDGFISTVIGDGTPSSAGEGSPARLFPVDAPESLACDSNGNLYVTSRTAIRQVLAGEDGVATGDDAVRTIYGAPPANDFPEPITRCLSGLMVEADRLKVIDRCQGIMIDLERSP